MKARELLRAFEVLAEAPGGIQRLRELVLELAVRGKLVEQDPGDEPAEVLLKRIAVERGKKRDKTIARGGCGGGEERAPFDAPPGWVWRCVGQVGSVQLGRQRSPSNHFGPHMVPYLRVANVLEARLNLDDVKQMNFEPAEQVVFRLEDGDVLLNEGQSYELVGRPARYSGEIPGCCFQNTLIRFRPSLAISSDFAVIVFRAYLHNGRFQAVAQQTTNIAHLSAGRLSEIEFPVPPLPEQHRIVARVDALMALLDRLENARNAHEAARQAARDSALAALREVQDAHAAEAAWNLISARMDALFASPDDVAPLRQAILQLAVRGRLVRQEAGDDPATVFLRELDKRRSTGANTKIHSSHQPVLVDHFPSLPSGWTVVPLAAVYISRDSERIPVSSEERALRHGPFDYYGASGVIDTIDDYLFDQPLLLVGEDGANLVLRNSPIAFMARGKYWVNNHAHVLDSIDEGALRYLAIFLNATDLKPYLTGTAQPKLNQAKMNGIPCPVPPLPEQHRIVAKVDFLMSICERLESRLTALRDAHAAFAAAAVHHLET